MEQDRSDDALVLQPHASHVQRSGSPSFPWSSSSMVASESCPAFIVGRREQLIFCVFFEEKILRCRSSYRSEVDAANKQADENKARRFTFDDDAVLNLRSSTRSFTFARFRVQDLGTARLSSMQEFLNEKMQTVTFW